MPIEEQHRQIKKEGIEKEEFTISFTNGSLEQIRELRDFFKIDDDLTVIKLGISILQKTKEAEERRNKKSE